MAKHTTTNRVKWTPEQIEIVRANYSKLSTNDILPLVGIQGLTANQLNCKAAALGLKKDKEAKCKRLSELRSAEHAAKSFGARKEKPPTWKTEKKSKTAPKREIEEEPDEDPDFDAMPADEVYRLNKPKKIFRAAQEIERNQTEEEFNEDYYSDPEQPQHNANQAQIHIGNRYK